MSDDQDPDVTPEELPELKITSQDMEDDRQRIKEAIEALGDDLDPVEVRKITGGVAVYNSKNFPKTDEDELDSPKKPSHLPRDVYELDPPKDKGR